MASFDFSFFESGVRFDTPNAQPSSTMRNLSRFLDNPFDDKDISIAELIAFTTDHLERMIANNTGGVLSARITATSQSFDVVADCVTDDQGKLGIRKARKQAKDNFRKSLPASVTKIVAAVIAQYGDGSPEVTECVPSGRSIFSTCRDDQVEVHLQTLVTAITAHQADLGAPLVTAATNLKNAWVTIHRQRILHRCQDHDRGRQANGPRKPPAHALPQPRQAHGNVPPPAREAGPLHDAAPAGESFITG